MARGGVLNNVKWKNGKLAVDMQNVIVWLLLELSIIPNRQFYELILIRAILVGIYRRQIDKYAKQQDSGFCSACRRR